jgi:signal transduction histidine kinase
MAEQDVLADLSPAAAAKGRQRLSEARDLVDHSIVEIRRLIAALSPAILEQIGLAAALRQLVQRFRRLHPKTSVRVKLPRRLEMSKRAEIIVYRLAQECFNNIAKYSSATRVNLSVESADSRLCLQIEDNGVGFDVQEALSRRDRYGLSGMRERVALLGGSLELRSRKREDASPPSGVAQPRSNRPGTLVRVWLPLTEDVPPDEGAGAQKIASS